MNHCRDCNSDYATPGTCNCFAPGQKRHLAPSPISVPYVQPWYPWVQPYYPPPITWGTTITNLPCSDATITAWNGTINTTGTVSYESAVANSAGMSFTGVQS